MFHRRTRTELHINQPWKRGKASCPPATAYAGYFSLSPTQPSASFSSLLLLFLFLRETRAEGVTFIFDAFDYKKGKRRKGGRKSKTRGQPKKKGRKGGGGRTGHKSREEALGELTHAQKVSQELPESQPARFQTINSLFRKESERAGLS